MLGLLPGHSDPVAAGEGAPPAIAAIRAALAPGQRSFSVAAPAAPPCAAIRRAGRASSGDAAPRTAETGAEPGGAPPRTAPAPPQADRRRRRAAGQAAEAGAAAGPGEDLGPAPAWRAAQGEANAPKAAARARGSRRPGIAARGIAARDRGDRRDRGGRGAPPRRVIEQKLYSVDSIVDRGFEDVEEEGETRRVHWTIVKRTTADQISRKPVATVYVVQREGADTEFPTLGTARSAVNKTIVHPEKLTPSKAERADREEIAGASLCRGASRRPSPACGRVGSARGIRSAQDELSMRRGRACRNAPRFSAHALRGLLPVGRQPFIDQRDGAVDDRVPHPELLADQLHEPVGALDVRHAVVQRPRRR